MARSCEVDDKKKTIKLSKPSIINGSQTQGVLKDFFEEYELPNDLVLHITFELIVTDDEDLIAEISIARNFQNDVLSISIAGRRGQLDELEKAMKEEDGSVKLRKKESQFHGEDFLNTEKLLQVLMVLTPPSLLGKLDENECQVYAYNRKEKCIKEYAKIESEAKDTKHPEHQKSLALYNYFLQIAPQAWKLYKVWKSHPGFKGTRLRSIDRDHSGDVVEVPDGLVFPILSALAIFAEPGEGPEKRWSIRPPSSFTETDLIKAAKTVYQEIALSKPHLMGKSRPCYTQLRQITALYKKLSTPRQP